MNSARDIVWLADVDAESEHFGTHSKHIARLIQAKFPLTPGFVITAHAYRNFLQENNLEFKIKQLLSTISFERPESLMQAEFHIRQLFQQAPLIDTFYDQILDFYLQLGNEVTLEMHETGKHDRMHAKKEISSESDLLNEIINAWSEMFTGKALWHRHQRNVDHFGNKAEIIVKKKIQGEKTGKVFTIDPQNHAKDKLVIITTHPHVRDEYILSKKNLTIIDRKLKHTHFADKLTLEEIHTIANLAKRLEEHLFFPQEISWMLDNSLLYISEIKPVTEPAKINSEKKRILPIGRGKGLTPAIGTGVVQIINYSINQSTINEHNIIVTSELKPNQLKKLKKIKGLIIEEFANSETAALIKHLGIPAICNVKNATKSLRNGNIITINGTKGEIYQGGFF